MKAPPEVEIRPVAAADVRALRALALRPGQPPEASIYPHDEDAQTLHLGAFAPDGSLVGIAMLLPPEDRVAGQPPYGAPGLRFRGLGVHPDGRRRGIGSLLLTHLRSAAKERGARELWANARLSSLPFFEARSFKIVSTPFELPVLGLHVVIARAP